MKLKYISIILITLLVPLLFTSCSSEIDEPKMEVQNIDPEPVENTSPTPVEEEPSFTPQGLIELLAPDKVDDSYILVNDAGKNRVFLMSKDARLLYEWNLTNNIGNDVFLLPNGQLLASLEADDPAIKLGGKGGKIQFIDADNNVDWEFIYSSLEGETHHDVELLPNGNIIAMVWERKTKEEAINAGSILDHDVFVESIIEINPSTNEIVWEWNSWDHLIQSEDSTKANFGDISNHPERIDLNYVTTSGYEVEIKGDIMHANAIAYDKTNDVILLSVNFYSEVWVIDHSTTTAEAASSTGGNYNKGGDLIYRFGNPEAYNNSMGNRIFYNQHFPNLLNGKDEGKLLIFSNGNHIGQSTVYEMELPATYDLQANTNNELRVTWSFTNQSLYSPKVSGAVKLANDNILITEGDFGIWEVTRAKEVVWKFNGEGFFWRSYSYSKDAPEIKSLNLLP